MEARDNMPRISTKDAPRIIAELRGPGIPLRHAQLGWDAADLLESLLGEVELGRNMNAQVMVAYAEDLNKLTAERDAYALDAKRLKDENTLLRSAFNLASSIPTMSDADLAELIVRCKNVDAALAAQGERKP